MPVSCCAVNCTNRFKAGSGIGFYVFPVNEDKRKAWIRAVSRYKWQPKPSDRLCGAHFVKGRPSKDPNDIDFIPTIFVDKKRRVRVPAVDSMRAERRAKREKSREEGEYALATADDLVGCTGKEQSAATTSKDASSQTDPVLLPVDEGYIRKNQELSAKVVALQEEVDSFHFSYGRHILQLMAGSDNKTKFYTGLPTYAVFKALFDYLEPKMLHARRDSIKDNSKGRKRKLSLMEEFLSVLMRLRLGLVMEDVADRFQISIGTCSRVFHTWIKVTAQEMKVIFPWPSRERVKAAMPKQFAPYPNTRIIIDCTEFFIQRPTSLQSQCETFSHYKHHNTFKVLIGISPSGVITFVSELWRGRVSDQTITEAACLSLPSYTCTSSANNFTTSLQHNVNSVCCLGLQRCKAVSLHNHYTAVFSLQVVCPSIRNQAICKVLVRLERFEGLHRLFIERFLLAVDQIVVQLHEGEVCQRR